MDNQRRGVLSRRIQDKSLELLGYELTTTHLRLMPYIASVMMDDQRIDPRKVNADERLILQQWRDEEHIQGGAGGLCITKEFWDIIHELIFLGYVDLI